MITLHNMINNASRVAEIAMRERGEVAPLWIGHTADGELVPVAVPMHDKNMEITMVRLIFRERGVVAHVMMAEAWMASVPEGTSLDAMPAPSKRPDRVEIVQLVAEEIERGAVRQLAAYRKIIRPQNRKPFLGPLIKWDEPLHGRMSNVLATEQ